MPKYCPTCGNSSDNTEFYGNFCAECTRQKLLKSLPTEVEVQACKRCGKIRAGSRDLPPDSRGIELALRQALGKYTVHLSGMDGEIARVSVTCDTEYGPVSAEQEMRLDYKKRLCETCYKKACNYHEAVVQLRGNRYKIGKFVERMTRYLDSNDAFVSKMEENEHGIDMYVSNKRLAAAFISKMKLHPNTSFTLVGLKNGKRVYKNTYAIRYE